MDILSGAEGMRVLIADDDPPSAKLMSAIMASMGLRPEVVGDGEAAIVAAAASRFDLILMDISMPGMSGTFATRRLRQEEGRAGARRTPVYLVSSQDDRDVTRACDAASADGYLTKPFIVADFQGLVKTALSRTAMAPAGGDHHRPAHDREARA